MDLTKQNQKISYRPISLECRKASMHVNKLFLPVVVGIVVVVEVVVVVVVVVVVLVAVN